MKGESKELKITEISLEDFKKLNLYVYEKNRHTYRKVGDNISDNDVEIPYEEAGEFVTDSHGGKHYVSFSDVYSKLQYDKVSLNKLVDENIDFSKEQGWSGAICVAIHEVAAEDDIKDFLQCFNHIPGDKDNEKLFEKQKKNQLMLQSMYCDKFTTQGRLQSYLLRCDVWHLYSKRNYFYTKDDYFEIDKRETKAVYLIHW